LTIRPATAADAAAIMAIWNAAIRETLVTFNPVEKTEAEVAAVLAARTGPAGATFVAD
jgi:phosphinothricin acetyltransferase